MKTKEFFLISTNAPLVPLILVNIEKGMKNKSSYAHKQVWFDATLQ
jgi:hypothetical protein